MKFELEDIIIDSANSERALLTHIQDFKIDSKGQYYLLTDKQPCILHFKSNGQFLRHIGSRGRGPGDFLQPYKIFIDNRGYLHIYDNGNRNVTELDSTGEVQTIVRINQLMKSDIFISPEKKIFGFIRKFGKNGAVKKLVSFNKRGEPSAAIAAFSDSGFMMKRSKKGGGVVGGIIHAYSPNAYLYPLDTNSFCYGYNLENKIYIYHVKEKKIQTIPLPAAMIPIPENEKEYLEKRYGEMALLPAYRPFFNKLLTDEKGRIYVVRVRPIFNKEKHQLMDVFSKEGEYIYQMRCPVETLLIWGGWIYASAEDDSHNIIVKRFRIKNYKSMKF